MLIIYNILVEILKCFRLTSSEIYLHNIWYIILFFLIVNSTFIFTGFLFINNTSVKYVTQAVRKALCDL